MNTKLDPIVEFRENHHKVRDGLRKGPLEVSPGEDNQNSENRKTEQRCLNCGTSSEDRILLSAQYKGDPAWVCVTCLPQLIHGAH